MSYIDKIDEYCKQHKISHTRFEREAGIGKGLISKWKSKGITPRIDSLRKSANYMKIPFQELMRDDPALMTGEYRLPGSGTDYPDALYEATPQIIPVYRYLNQDDTPPSPEEVLTHFAVLPDNIESADECFGYTIKDSSMSPYIEAGDVVIVRSDDCPDSGDTVIVCTPGEQTVCRRLIRDRGTLVLQPYNPHYEPEIYREEELELLPVIFKGKVTAVIRLVKSSSFSVPEL